MRFLLIMFCLAGIALGSLGAESKYSVKPVDQPAKAAPAIQAVLEPKGWAVLDASGQTLLTVWPRKSLTLKNVTGEIKYGHLDEGTLLGVVELPAIWGDYRKQKIKAGVYTLRFGLQPMDGDHMGTAPYNEFFLLVPADKDASVDAIEPKELHEMSAESSGGKHPAVMLLYPNKKPGEPPHVEAKPQETYVLNYSIPVTVGGATRPLGFSLVVVGHSMAE